jgi:hypothetical protein
VPGGVAPLPKPPQRNRRPPGSGSGSGRPPPRPGPGKGGALALQHGLRGGLWGAWKITPRIVVVVTRLGKPTNSTEHHHVYFALAMLVYRRVLVGILNDSQMGEPENPIRGLTNQGY